MIFWFQTSTSANWHHRRASLRAWTRRAVSSAPVRKDMSLIPMESLVEIWMSAPPASTTASTNVSTPPEATSVSVLKDIRKSTTNALVRNNSFIFVITIKFHLFILTVQMSTSASNNRAFAFHLPSASTHSAVSSVCVLAASNWTKLAISVWITTSVWMTVDARTDARWIHFEIKDDFISFS